MVMSVISRVVNVVVKLSIISKICKYRRFYEGYHFISMIVEVHNTLGCDKDCFIKKCVHFFHNRRLRGHLFLFFCILFFRQHVNIAFSRCFNFYYRERGRLHWWEMLVVKLLLLLHLTICTMVTLEELWMQ
jgi:hypothetical protein